MPDQIKTHIENESGAEKLSPLATPLSEITTGNEAEGCSMNTTVNTATATLTEKELFRQFLKLHVQRYTNFGAVTNSYIPENLLQDSGEYWDILTELGEQVIDTLESDDGPEEGLDLLIDDLERYLGNLRNILSDFRALKAVAIVLPDEPQDADKAAAAEWEKAYAEAEDNPCYHSVIEIVETQEVA